MKNLICFAIPILIGNIFQQLYNVADTAISCSAAVLCAFHEMSGLSESEAQKKAVPFASGRAGKCGAVMAAEYVLKQMYGNHSDDKISEFEEKFINSKKGSVMCRDLQGRVPGSCRACVTDAALILEGML